LTAHGEESSYSCCPESQTCTKIGRSEEKRKLPFIEVQKAETF
jgi:hypothetical protein